ncbi:ABC transporter permease [Pseudomonas sp. IT-196MI5]
MAPHGDAAIPAASRYDGEDRVRVSVHWRSSIVLLPVFVLVLVVSFSQFRSDAAEPWIIVTRGILNTSIEGS